MTQPPLEPLLLQPIGVFHAQAKYPYDVGRQGSIAETTSVGTIELLPGRGFEQALDDLDGFERIWVLFQFHKNTNWKAKVIPPRGPRVKRGVFATRAPYRPNAIGISCVRLLRIEPLRLFVSEFDLLDETPIFDIKPYLPYADSFPQARIGWLDGIDAQAFTVTISATAEEALHWLDSNGLPTLRGFLHAQLEFEPLDDERKRVTELADKNQYMLAYRTWRTIFSLDFSTRTVTVTDITSGYLDSEVSDDGIAIDDRYGDKRLHRDFMARFHGRRK